MCFHDIFLLQIAECQHYCILHYFGNSPCLIGSQSLKIPVEKWILHVHPRTKISGGQFKFSVVILTTSYLLQLHPSSFSSKGLHSWLKLSSTPSIREDTVGCIVLVTPLSLSLTWWFDAGWIDMWWDVVAELGNTKMGFAQRGRKRCKNLVLLPCALLVFDE